MITLERTCWACPEQYDALNENGETIGYLRLRHGSFTVECPNALENLVYQSHPKGDGIFDDDERMKYLIKAVMEIQRYHNMEVDGHFKLIDEWENE